MEELTLLNYFRSRPTPFETEIKTKEAMNKKNHVGNIYSKPVHKNIQDMFYIFH